MSTEPADSRTRQYATLALTVLSALALMLMLEAWQIRDWSLPDTIPAWRTAAFATSAIIGFGLGVLARFAPTRILRITAAVVSVAVLVTLVMLVRREPTEFVPLNETVVVLGEAV